MSTLNKTYQFIKYEIEGNIGILSINRADKLNALNQEVLAELKEFLTELRTDKDFSIRGLILTGEGEKAFIAGADISAMSTMDEKEGYQFGALGQHVTLQLEGLRIPVIACVSGFALGGGCEMAMSCDFIYATNSAVFGQPEVKLGLIPGFGGTQRLARLVGRNRAKELIYTGRNIKSDEAFRLGLVLQLFESKQQMIEAAKATLKEAAKNSPYAISLAKKVMNAGNDLTVQESLTQELDQFSNIFTSEDMREGTTAFVAKRKPDFKGR